MQMLLALPLVAQEHFTSNELFINDIVVKPLKASTLNAKDGDTINDYQEERQFIDDYLKRINPNFSAGDLRVITDLINEQHFRFKILYKNIIVEDHELTLHPDSDTTMSVTGMNLFSHDIVTTPSITQEQAIEKLKSENNRISDKSILSSELVIYKNLRGAPYLSYKITVEISIREKYNYYVSAIDSDILEKRTLVRTYTSSSGIAELENWGQQNIETSYDSQTAKYILFDQTANIHTYNLNQDTNKLSAVNLYDSDNYWTMYEFPETNTNSLNAGLVAHWSARQAYDFFKTNFNINGYNDNYPLLNLYVNYGDINSGWEAFWRDENSIFLGSCYNFASRSHHLSVFDVIAHEYGHAITTSAVNLIYAGESGAIDEGLADIWAVCIENYLGGSSYEIWNMGNHLDSIFRCISNPNSTNQPDTYGGTHWEDPTNLYEDNGGVHTNSSLMSYWFYLLVNGGNGINDNNEK